MSDVESAKINQISRTARAQTAKNMRVHPLNPNRSKSVSLINVDILRQKNKDPILGLLAKFKQDPCMHSNCELNTKEILVLVLFCDRRTAYLGSFMDIYLLRSELHT